MNAPIFCIPAPDSYQLFRTFGRRSLPAADNYSLQLKSLFERTDTEYVGCVNQFLTALLEFVGISGRMVKSLCDWLLTQTPSQQPTAFKVKCLMVCEKKRRRPVKKTAAVVKNDKRGKKSQSVRNSPCEIISIK